MVSQNDLMTTALMNQKTVHVDSSAPGTPYDGQFWVDTTTDPPIVKCYDNTNTTWVEYHAVYYETQSGGWASPSASPVNNGDLVVVYNSTQVGTRLYGYSNGAWVNLGSTPTTSAGIFGTGAEGALSTSGDVTLTENRDYTNLTVNAGHTVYTAGFHLRCSGTLSVNATGVITDNSTGGAAGTGGAGGLAADTSNGGNGTNGGTGGSPGTFATSGDGGQGGGGGGGGGALAQGTTEGDGGAGGAGGKGGGTVIIYCSILDNSGTIHANGADAVAGTNGVAGPGDGDGSGGGGGGGGSGGDGGTCEVYYGTLTTLGTITANGGALGAAGSGGTFDAGGGGGIYSGGDGGDPNGATGDNNPGDAGGQNGGGGGGGYVNEGTAGGAGGAGANGAAGTLYTEAVA